MKTRRGIENAIINIFDKWGYDEVKHPILNMLIPRRCRCQRGSPFFDRSNNLLALRNDMTAPIARLTATRLQGGEKIKRLCYLANLYRYEEIQAGRQNLSMGRCRNAKPAALPMPRLSCWQPKRLQAAGLQKFGYQPGPR